VGGFLGELFATEGVAANPAFLVNFDSAHFSSPAISIQQLSQEPDKNNTSKFNNN